VAIQAKSGVKANLPAGGIVFESEHFEATTMHDLALQIEILALFSDQLHLTMEKLKAELLDLQQQKFIGHTLRGAAAAVGAVEIEQLARNLEQGCKPTDMLPQLAEAWTRFREQTGHYTSH
jgi:HPt (histidine-containing phosphotransfer) domain-containing protein